MGVIIFGDNCNYVKKEYEEVVLKLVIIVR